MALPFTSATVNALKVAVCPVELLETTFIQPSEFTTNKALFVARPTDSDEISNLGKERAEIKDKK
jgi:hypothetical protein